MRKCVTVLNQSAYIFNPERNVENSTCFEAMGSWLQVFREKDADASTSQADLALTYHNMACCLERCGQVQKVGLFINLDRLSYLSINGLQKAATK